MKARPVKRLVAPGVRIRWGAGPGPAALPRRARLVAAAALAAAFVGGASAGGCGTNLQAAYEGDVRFEHCIALDARLEVRSPIRRACWSEWLAFYTYGQTRDRVLHAFQRLRELDGGFGAAADTLEGEPEPSATPSPSAQTAAGGGCIAECESILTACSDECTTRSCRGACASAYRSCTRRCPS